MSGTHNQSIVDQFTRQAIPFATKAEHTQEAAMQVLLEAMELREGDTLLDVACGPGLTACAFAARIRQVTGLDITPAMIEQARKRAAELKLGNTKFVVGDVEALPFGDGDFSVVFSRYAFHHFEHPERKLAEMGRVCAPGGKVVVVDVYTTSEAQQAAYDTIEKLRDPSHVSALRLDQWRTIAEEAKLRIVGETFYRLEMDFDELMASSFPNAGDGAKARALMAADIAQNITGFEPRQVGDVIRFSFPVVVYVMQA